MIPICGFPESVGDPTFKIVLLLVKGGMKQRPALARKQTPKPYLSGDPATCSITPVALSDAAMKLRIVIQMATQPISRTPSFTATSAGRFSFGCWQRGHFLRVHRNGLLQCGQSVRNFDVGWFFRQPDEPRAVVFLQYSSRGRLANAFP